MIATRPLFDSVCFDWDATFNPVVRKQFSDWVDRFNSRVVRSIQQFAEEEIILPTGPREGLPFDIHTQPFAKLLWDEFDNEWWNEYAITGCSQTGKSLLGFAIPVVWLLCEKGEDVIIAAPTKEILHDKVRRDILPLINKTRYAHYWPTKGGGSQGGVPDLIELANGATLKLMSFEGSDKSKSSFTCHNIVFTEIDGMKKKLTSDEANAMKQILARARATSKDKRFILFECTVTFEDGPIWQLVNVKGSAAKIAVRCPHCRKRVSLEREHLKGWEECEDVLEVEEKTHWHCAACDHPWTEEERYAANCDAVLVHRGQTLNRRQNPKGKLPATRTLGFRFTASNSTFLPAKDIGVDCWEARENPDEIDAEKELCQFVFVVPFTAPARTEIEINRTKLEQRKFDGWTKGLVPDGTQWITIGADLGLTWCHWVAIAWIINQHRSCGAIIDYGRIEMALYDGENKVTARQRSFSEIFFPAFGAWKAKADRGWQRPDGELVTYDHLWVDSRWQGEDKDDAVVYNAIATWNDPRIMPVIGHSSTNYSDPRYRKPRRRGRSGEKMVREIGNGYHVESMRNAAKNPLQSLDVAHVNSDNWKRIVQSRATTDPTQPGALILYDSMNPREHQTIAKHWDSQHYREDFIPQKGVVGEWIIKSHQDHFLDATGYGCAAGHYAGYRKVPTKSFSTKPPVPLRASLPFEDKYGRV